eukprot:172708-Pyramimonas_sp.AAC.1
MRGEGGEHGRICEHSRFTITNQCPNCRPTFASRQTAINRLVVAYRSGQCLKHRSVCNFEMHDPPQLFRPSDDCELTFPDLSEL